jgi:hypothetical protein
VPTLSSTPPARTVVTGDDWGVSNFAQTRYVPPVTLADERVHTERVPPGDGSWPNLLVQLGCARRKPAVLRRAATHGNKGITKTGQWIHRGAYIVLVGALGGFLCGLRFAYNAILPALGGG